MTEILSIIISLLGGLALFLYGMKMMSNGLELTAGNQMKQILEKLTSNRFVGILVGAAVTALIQSSSATTVMVVSFVGSGIMTLEQAVWIIFGANIGTTMTNFLTALNMDQVACILSMLGVGMIVFMKKPKLNNIGLIISGLGFLFIGMEMMSSAVEPLKHVEAFKTIMSTFSNPFIGIGFGALFTAMIQSSSASIGVLQSLSSTGAITLGSSIFLIFGMNIGTCITAALASLGSGTEAKRTAMIHLLFNILGTAVFMVGIQFVPYVSIIEGMTSQPRVQIALANIFYKTLSTIIFLPFGYKIVDLARKIVKDKDDDKQSRLVSFNSNFHLGNVSVAIQSLSKEIDYMMLLVIQNVTLGFEALISHDTSAKDDLYARENEINQCRNDINAYMEEVSALELNHNDSELIMSYYKVTSDLERLGDYARHMMKYAGASKPLNEEAIQEIGELYQKLSEGFVIFQDPEIYVSGKALEVLNQKEEEVDELIKKFLDNQSQRIKDKKTTPSRMAMYSNVLTDIQRIFDHMMKIIIEGTRHNYSVIAPSHTQK